MIEIVSELVQGKSYNRFPKVTHMLIPQKQIGHSPLNHEMFMIPCPCYFQAQIYFLQNSGI
jgi:hypothetical protein